VHCGSSAIAAARVLIRNSAAASLCRLLRDGLQDRLVQAFRLGGEVLVLPHQLGETIAAGREPNGELPMAEAAGCLYRVLHHIEAVVARLLGEIRPLRSAARSTARATAGSARRSRSAAQPMAAASASWPSAL